MSTSSKSPSTPEQNGLRSPSRRTWVLAAVGAASGGAMLLSCGGGGGGGGGGAASLSTAGAGSTPGPAPAPPPGVAPPAPAAPPGPATPATSGSAPTLGAHSLAFHRLRDQGASVSASGLSTRASGSTLLVGVGRGDLISTAPTDSAGNVFVQLDQAHSYTQFPAAGTTLHACEQARGMDGHVVTVVKGNLDDEVTLTVVEVAGGGAIRDVQWRQVPSGQPLTSATVTTTGPALLVAWWWGDADVQQDKTAVPDNGFTVIDSVLAQGALVQCAVAVRQVEAAGSYNVTWASTPQQGAQLWLVAVQQAAT